VHDASGWRCTSGDGRGNPDVPRQAPYRRRARQNSSEALQLLIGRGLTPATGTLRVNFGARWHPCHRPVATRSDKGATIAFVMLTMAGRPARNSHDKLGGKQCGSCERHGQPRECAIGRHHRQAEGRKSRGALPGALDMCGDPDLTLPPRPPPGKFRRKSSIATIQATFLPPARRRAAILSVGEYVGRGH
jgi:hypothetical protein